MVALVSGSWLAPAPQVPTVNTHVADEAGGTRRLRASLKATGRVQIQVLHTQAQGQHRASLLGCLGTSHACSQGTVAHGASPADAAAPVPLSHKCSAPRWRLASTSSLCGGRGAQRGGAGQHLTCGGTRERLATCRWGESFAEEEHLTPQVPSVQFCGYFNKIDPGALS